MTDARAVVHQIEYRWDPVKDMSPVASSLSPDMTQAWDLRIRPWVRHPNVEAPSESVCYQVLSADTAALAWRYRNWQAAEREDGGHGRPFASRVLIGPVSLLSPPLAILLCRVGLPGLPDVPGLRPDQVEVGAGLLPIYVSDLTELVTGPSARLDQSAAQEKGLPQVVAAALSDPDIPLAIQLQDPDIFDAPSVAPQSLLLWGLWRTVGSLLGPEAGRRGWSFSTFELPMGNQDTSTLPAIVFRLTQAMTGPPVNSRPEIRVRPGDANVPVSVHPDVTELAEWLVSEYRDTNGSRLRQLIAGCGPGQPLPARLQLLGDMLRDKWSPVSMSGPAVSFVPVPPGRAMAPGPVDHDELSQAEEGQGVAEQAEASSRELKPDYWDTPHPHDAPGDRGVSSGEPWPAAPPPAEASPPTDVSPRTDVPTSAAEFRSAASSMGPRQEILPVGGGQRPSVVNLLRSLDTEPDSQRFQSILKGLLSSTAEFDERVAMRYQLPKSGWYIAAFERHGYKNYVPHLAGIFQVFVLPDLTSLNVAATLGGWVREGPPEVAAALLTAAKVADEQPRSSGKNFRLMTDVLGEAALEKLLAGNGIPFDWPRPSHGAKPGHRQAGGGWLAKIFGRSAP